MDQSGFREGIVIAYIIRRLVFTIPIVVGVTLILFIVLNVVGGDPVFQRLGKNATQKEITEMRKQYGLDLPPAQQYFFWLKKMVTFNFGRSWDSHQKITTMIGDGIGPSLSIAIPAFVLGIFFAIIISLIVAFFQNSWIDRSVVVFCVVGLSVSSLVYIIAGQYWLAFVLDWFPISGWEPGFRGIPYLMLPISIWVLASLGSDVRFYRTMMVEETRQEYILTARAKGLNEKVIMLKHLLKNALIPIITRVIIQIPFLYAGSLLLEKFFVIPGLGNMMLNGIFTNDWPVIWAMTFVGSLLYILFNLLTDIFYQWVDPRVTLN